jgi:hypothetical protein
MGFVLFFSPDLPAIACMRPARGPNTRDKGEGKKKWRNT